MPATATPTRRQRRQTRQRRAQQLRPNARRRDEDDWLPDPHAAAFHQMQRFMGAYLGAGGGFDGAIVGSPRSSWDSTGGTPDQVLIPALPTLRARSWQLYNNSGPAVGIVESLVSNMIGTGITPEPKLDAELLGLTSDQTKELQRAAVRCWRRWAPYADVTGEQSIEGLQEMWFRAGILDGDVFPRAAKSGVPGAPYTLAVQTIGAGQVDSPTGAALKNRRISGGVEKNKAGMPIAIWVQDDVGKLAGDAALHRGSRKMRRVPVWNGGRREVLHWSRKLQRGQSRGMPWLAPVLTDFKDHSDYRRAALFAAKVAACLTLIVKHKGRSNPWPKIQEFVDGENQRRLGPGATLDLYEGEEVDMFDPKRTSEDHGDFSRTILRSICAGVNLPYEVALKDFSKSSWSNARAAVLEARRIYRMLIASFSRQILQPLWLMLQEEAWRRGELPHLRTWDPHLMRANWHGAGWEWVDPAKEGQAQKMALEMGVTTREAICRDRGSGAYEDVVDQLAYELDLRDEKLPAPPAPPAASQDDGEEDQDDEPEDADDQDEDGKDSQDQDDDES